VDRNRKIPITSVQSGVVRKATAPSGPATARIPFILTLTGPAGGQWRAGSDGENHELDALDFCWIVGSRQAGTGLLATEVPF
jgi:hypothetical protein